MIQTDPMELDMFRLQVVDDYISLQALVSIKELVQIATTIGGANVATTNLVAGVLPNGVKDDGGDNEVH
jgi:hypothetical protein